MTEVLKIPIERVSTLVGDKGKTKKSIEKKCNVELDIDSDGDVEINGESTDTFFAKDIVKAIGRGFEPKQAMKLADQDYNLYVIALKEILPNENAITRMKGRVIGEKGKMKYEIESATDSIVCIYGNTVSIISKIDSMEYAKESIAMLLDGAPHTTVLNYLAKARREIMDLRLKTQ
ncbi:RNA-processing protein [Candidatus Micrarchaeota archaeon]|nr:RNA-processing protein [Candidatus Micrarchaeota archaeon]